MSTMLLGLLGAAAVQAADWPTLQGTEPPGAALRSFGFVQVAAEGIASAPVEGLTAETLLAHNGERAAFNTFGGESPWALTLRRARLGVRGELPGTEGRLSAFVAAELGQNDLTVADGVWQPRLVDAAVTVRGAAPAGLRVGLLRLPLSDESLEAVHVATDLIRYTPVTGRLLMERDASGGVYAGPASGFRDVGVQAFGSHLHGALELSWAAVGSVGTTRFADIAPQPTATARLQVSHLPAGAAGRRSPGRPESSVWGFAQVGLRDIGAEEDARRVRLGAGAQAVRDAGRLRVEGVWAQGVLNVGLSPPFAGGSLQLAPEGTAWGATGLATARLAARWEVGVAGAHLDSLPDGGPDRRLLDEVTGIGQYHLAPAAWVNLNAGWRSGRAPEGSADAVRILDTLGPYAGLQVTAGW